MTQQVAPYGNWRSPIGARLLGEASVGLSEVRTDGEDVYWLEQRPHERGRGVVVRVAAGAAAPADAVPAGVSVGSRVNEYGGGAYAVSAGTIVYVDDDDQRLYRVRPGEAPVAITPEPRAARGLRYADIDFFVGGEHLVCVRESHEASGEPVHELVRVPIDGARAPEVVASGRDFYACPRVSPDGRRLAWIAWDHPHMPWDRSEAWTAEIDAGSGVRAPRRVAGGGEESIFQVAWSPGGELVIVSDRSGFWNLYRSAGASLEPLAPVDAELGYPAWVFGLSTVAFLSEGRIACAYQSEGLWSLGVIAPGSGRIAPIEIPHSDLPRSPRLVAGARDGLLFVGGSPARAPEVVRITLGADLTVEAVDVLRGAMTLDIDPASLSVPEPVTFPTGGGRTAHALFYPPAHATTRGPDGERPPLIVMAHGGPTSQTSSALSLDVQFWTSRGIAVADVNYGGSSGYGRAYRERLRGQWGVVDVDDCVMAASHLADEGRVDRSRMAMRGGSAGGYTTLSALVFREVFAAGASRYGVGDIEALAAETHKFESRYVDYLVGPYPEAKALYRERSPVHHADRLSCPVILLQGLEDAVVPPAQAERLIEVLEAKGLTYAYVTFPDEGHGFRKAESRIRAAEAELAFFGRVFGFEPADDLPALEVRNG